MKTFRPLIALSLYILSLSTLLAMALTPAAHETTVELGPATVIAVEAPAPLAGADSEPLLRREIS